jgi:hypothetical protein
MGRFLLPLIVSGLTIIAVNSALAKGGGPLHLFKSQLPPVSRAGVPGLSVSPSDSGYIRGKGAELNKMSIRLAVIALALLPWVDAVYAHGIAGNRFFVGTLTFDDPAVADEAVLPDFSSLNHPAQGSNVTENRINWSFVRLLTPTLAVSIDSGWIHQNWPIGQTSGFDTTDIGLKYEAFRNNEHEALVSVGLAWGIGQSGAQGVDADEPNTVRPAVFFGKGFGDLPDWLSWARPLAVTKRLTCCVPHVPGMVG